MNTHHLEEEKMQTKHKKRTRKIQAQLLEQVEFYFGDANLHKDRFMKQEISKNPEGYVAISIIASFNRMKQLTDDIKLLVKAMKMSSLLELNEDETLVRRKTPVPEPRNVDAETIYVEKLPPYADHDWVKGIFSKYGKVVYVSLPRYKHTGDIKGFAFVEFENAKDAQEAIQNFNKGGKSKQDNEPQDKTENGFSTDQLSEHPKITKGKRRRSHSESELETHKHKEKKRKRTVSESSVDSDNERHSDTKQKQEGLNRKDINKNKGCQEGVGEGADCKDKKGRKSVQWEEGEKIASIKKVSKSGVTPSVGQKRGHDDRISDEKGMEQKRQRISDKTSDDESCEEDTAKESKKQKKRKRKKKEKKETRLPHLRVISKLEWLQLKKEYKDKQREAMNNLKKQLEQSKPSVGNSLPETREKKKSQGLDDDALKGKNQNKIPNKSQEQIPEAKKLPYTPGVVLKFLCQNGETTMTDLRAMFTSHAPVAYLDFMAGSSEGHVRFHTAENCASVLEAMSSKTDEVKIETLTEEEEKSYWEKINADRIERYNSKRKKKRGTEKVARKADALQMQRQTHIRFDEDDDEGD